MTTLRRLLSGCLVASTMAVAGATASLAQETFIFGNSNPAGLNIGMSPFYYAEEMGFFTEEGLKIEYVNFNGGAVLDPQVANKSVDVGWQGPDSLIISHDEGNDPLPLEFFYNHLRKYVWEIAVPAGGPIKELKDLKGTKIGVNSLTTTSITTTKSMLRAIGLDPEKDVSFVAVGMGAPAFHALQSGQVDALNLFDTMHVMLANTGLEIRRIGFPPEYEQLFDNSFMTHPDNLTAKRKQLVGFGRAIAKATVGCYANLPACIQIAWKLNPKLKPADKSDEQAMKEATAVLEARGGSYAYFPGGDKRWGAFTDEMWTSRIAVLHENGILKSAGMDIGGFYTNDLVDEMNAFDADAVIAQAKALK
jgi:NitT/TauT family transport system substrate-binding protein